MLRAAYLQVEAAHALCYICGPEPYMWMLQLLLEDAGVQPGNIRRERFVINAAVSRHLPADKGAHWVSVLLDGQQLQFVNVYPDSILASAKAAGIRLPYSCNAGQCGSCTAICSAGSVWMSYNEVLTAGDLAAGRILTCTGHAVNGDVTLRF